MGHNGARPNGPPEEQGREAVRGSGSTGRRTRRRKATDPALRGQERESAEGVMPGGARGTALLSRGDRGPCDPSSRHDAAAGHLRPRALHASASTRSASTSAPARNPNVARSLAPPRVSSGTGIAGPPLGGGGGSVAFEPLSCAAEAGSAATWSAGAEKRSRRASPRTRGSGARGLARVVVQPWNLRRAASATAPTAASPRSAPGAGTSFRRSVTWPASSVAGSGAAIAIVGSCASVARPGAS